MAIGDFDGDGNTDIAVGERATDRVIVFRGDGSGRIPIGSPRRPQGLGGGGCGHGDRWHRLPGAVERRLIVDGRADHKDGFADQPQRPQPIAPSSPTSTATASSTWPPRSRDSTNLLIFLGQPAGGSMAAQRSVLGGAAIALASGDFDGDGVIDLFAGRQPFHVDHAPVRRRREGFARPANDRRRHRCRHRTALP